MSKDLLNNFGVCRKIFKYLVPWTISVGD